jgi:PDDEXK-like domain of unknown function (DUF3799)
MENKTGFVKESDDVYHATKALSASQLKLLAKSPKHYQKLFLEKKEDDEDESNTLRIGRLIHEFILQPTMFKEKYAIMPDPNNFTGLIRTVDDIKNKLKEVGIKPKGNKKEDLIKQLQSLNLGLHIWEEIITALGSKERITNDESDMLVGIYNSIQNYDFAKELLKIGDPEVSGYWFDEEYKVNCKFRADMITNNGYILEFKSTQDATYESFKRDIKKYRYDISAAWYLRGYKAITGQDAKAFIFIPMEKKEPYSVCLYPADDSIVEHGELGSMTQQYVGYVTCIERYKNGIEKNEWPGIQTEMQDMFL